MNRKYRKKNNRIHSYGEHFSTNPFSRFCLYSVSQNLPEQSIMLVLIFTKLTMI
ncbi:hypothetical protein LEP1GSC194_3074 [Leptospira alstonii serovar Sichuan str. 79601]|uniref:Uncharacterized protein n=1 Tax=Leptospira alstonii serovar Sichuan str. 79601 TaxID=1218565 RepID=M6DB19_9LEPT|nr:hypothetical protein LEP1GSC194_3074 [Leptospira alstonii serovar Sichuan str. 79601]